MEVERGSPFSKVEDQNPEVVNYLKSSGLIKHSGGIQLNMNVVPKNFGGSVTTDGDICDHNCLIKDGAGYDCPAAFTSNKGVKPKYLSPNLVTDSILYAQEGIAIANREMLAEGVFDNYYSNFKIPALLENGINTVLKEGNTEINFFGGNPEMYPDLSELISQIKKLSPNCQINLTTTGRLFIRNPREIDRLSESGVDILALSCDEVDLHLLSTMGDMSRSDIVREWKKVPPLQGARQKALEAIYSARAFSEIKSDIKPKILFNIVIHRGNMSEIYEIMNSLKGQFPDALLNPYFAQTAFYSGPPSFEKRHAGQIGAIIDWALKTSLARNFNLVPRPHYWLMLKAAFMANYGDPESEIMAVCGYNVWKCYEKLGALRYLQIGASDKEWGENKTKPGGHLGCFWNRKTISDNAQVFNNSPYYVSKYIKERILEIAKSSQDPCPGCSFPRLTADIISTEIGMQDFLLPYYFPIRKEYLGF